MVVVVMMAVIAAVVPMIAMIAMITVITVTASIVAITRHAITVWTTVVVDTVAANFCIAVAAVG